MTLQMFLILISKAKIVALNVRLEKKSFRKLFLVQKLDTDSVKLTQRHRGCCGTLCHSEHGELTMNTGSSVRPCCWPIDNQCLNSHDSKGIQFVSCYSCISQHIIHTEDSCSDIILGCLDD